MRRLRFRLWHGMALVAVSGLIAWGYVTLRPSDDIVLHDYYFLVVYGHEFPDTSPVFWVIVVLILAAPWILIAGCVTMAVKATKAVRGRFTRRPE